LVLRKQRDEPVLDFVRLVVVPHGVEKGGGGCVEVGEVEVDGVRVHSGRTESVFSEEFHHVGFCSSEDLEAHVMVGLLVCESVQKPEDVPV
jgi:hypothetical protein